MIKKNDNWFVCERPSVNTKLRLICIPYAGAGAAVYRTWGQQLGSAIEVCTVQLPGRENRINESPFNQIQPLVEKLADALGPYANTPYALYGHSMGALVAFELAHTLRMREISMPTALLLGAHRAAHLPLNRPLLHTLSDTKFLEKICEFGGFSNEALVSHELLELVLPTLRADFTVCETYVFENRPPLGCQIHAFAGKSDQDVSPAEIAPWGELTAKQFTMHQFDAGHFFIHSHLDLLLQKLRQILLSER